MQATAQYSPTDFSAAVANAKAAQEAREAEKQALYAKLRADAQVKIDAKAKAEREAEQAKADAAAERVESNLRFEAARGWPGDVASFVDWWLDKGRGETLAKEAARRQAEADGRLRQLAADF